MSDDDPRRRLDGVPDLDDAPLDWDPTSRRFHDEQPPAPARVTGSRPPVDERRLVIAAPPDGGRAAPPPRRPPHVVSPAPSATVAAPEDRPVADNSPKPATGTQRRWPPSRRTVLRAVAGTTVVLLLLLAGLLVWGYRRFDSIERVQLGSLLASDNGTNYLIVGSDTRNGIDPSDPNASAILGPDAPVGSERSDTILILRLDGDGAHMLSVPRDLLVTIAETGQHTRINAAFNGGATRLVATLTDQLGLPIHHYLEIDFVAFHDLVDALGGIVIDFPNPAFDNKSGLNVMQTGPVRLDGTQALAYVRSRYYTEIIDGQEVRDPTGDLGRIVRQQKFLSAVVSEIGTIRNPFRLMSVTDAMADGMRIDERLSFFDALRLVMRFRGLDPEPTSLPTSPTRLSSGAQVLELVQPGANEILARFGSPGATGS